MSNAVQRALLAAAAVSLTMSVVGCAASAKPFGSSVKQMIAAQSYHPPGARPSPGGPPLDGPKAAATMRAYRKDVGRPREVEKPLIIKVGPSR